MFEIPAPLCQASAAKLKQMRNHKMTNRPHWRFIRLVILTAIFCHLVVVPMEGKVMKPCLAPVKSIFRFSLPFCFLAFTAFLLVGTSVWFVPASVSGSANAIDANTQQQKTKP